MWSRKEKEREREKEKEGESWSGEQTRGVLRKIGGGLPVYVKSIWWGWKNYTTTPLTHAKLSPFASVFRRVCVHIHRFARRCIHARVVTRMSLSKHRHQWCQQRHSTFVWRYAISVIFQKGVGRIHDERRRCPFRGRGEARSLYWMLS